jgi:predicted methyltransferase
MNQKEMVLAHFKKRKSITSWEAIQKFGITRLAAVICDLKGTHNIIATIETAEGKRWARYTYMGTK